MSGGRNTVEEKWKNRNDSEKKKCGGENMKQGEMRLIDERERTRNRRAETGMEK